MKKIIIIFVFIILFSLYIRQVPPIQSGLIYNPTQKEMVDFLKDDKTDENKHNPIFYTCHDFSIELINHANEQGYRAGYIHFYGLIFDHSEVAFETSDRGIYIVDPQTDCIRRRVMDNYHTDCYHKYHITWI